MAALESAGDSRNWRRTRVSLRRDRGCQGRRGKGDLVEKKDERAAKPHG
jgi:hypothetical protein